MRKPRIGFLGVGAIGRDRMRAVLATGVAETVAIADASAEMVAQALAIAPAARAVADLDALLALDLDGVVIATPSALHAEHAIRALDAGVAVFCQKPLARDAAEAASVVAAARGADRLLAVDLSYRCSGSALAIETLVRGGALGHVFAVDLVFHNAHRPDKAWFYDRTQSGGGCVMDLGIHLVDLALWVLDFPAIDGWVTAKLFTQGAPVAVNGVEDFAAACFTLEGGTLVRIACSWRADIGCDARIAATFSGTKGSAVLRNLDGSTEDFVAEHYRGATAETIAAGPKDWAGRAAGAWAMQLAHSPCFDPAAERLVDVAGVLDRIYAGT